MAIDQTRLLRAAGRSPWTLAGISLLGLGTWAVCLIPSVSHALHASAHDVGLSVLLSTLSQAVMVVLYRRVSDRSILYGISALADQCLKHGLLMWLIYRSDRADSFFWLMYVVIGVINASMPEYRRLLGGIFVTAPVLLVLAFGLQEDWANMGLSILATGFSGLAFFIASHVSVRYAALMEERERLARELADLRVRDDRLRIARDLHDGIGADLAALAWRARRIHAELGGSPLSGELGGMTERASQSIDDLRSIVWALREKSQTWEELVAYVRQRCHELCADRAQVHVTDLAEGDQRSLPGDLCVHVVRSAQEAVRNALRHGGARNIRIRLQLEPRVVLTVEDDGAGISPDKLGLPRGGLANMRARAESMGGTLTVEPLTPGTRITLTCGAPAAGIERVA